MLVPSKHPLYKLHNKKRLATLLRVDPKTFKDIESHYKVYPFQKKVGNKKRDLYNTDMNYKRVLKRLNRLLCQVNIPEYVYSGIPRKDFLDNAISHRSSLYIHNADIKSFFPNTKESYVYGLFRNKFLTSPDVAKILTQLTTYLSPGDNYRHIPQGFPTSTILSYLTYFDMFNGIHKISVRNNIHFTLFVDDLTFSSESRIPKSFLDHVKNIVEKYNLEIHPKKIYRNNPYQFSNVTGVIIHPYENLLKAPNKLQKKMFENFKFINICSISSYSDYIQFKKRVLKLDGQLKSIKRIESTRHTPYVDKVLNDIKYNFLTPKIKGASYECLYKEFEFFSENKVIRKIK